jgi:hypothetical protein
MFGEGCELYRSMLQILQILSHPFCMQHKHAYTPEVVRCIVWAIIVDTHSFFDDIKLADDFVEQGDYMQFLASTLEGDYMSIKHGIKIQRHNFPTEWMTPELPPGGGFVLSREGTWGALSTHTWCPTSLGQPMDPISNTGQTSSYALPLGR